jgi:hypothetical protein
MTKTLLFVIPQATRTEACEIPLSAWLPVQQIVRDECHGHMTIHDHDAAGQFHDFPYFPGSHYALEITVDENETKHLLHAIIPRIEEIVARHTRKVAVPAGS